MKKVLAVLAVLMLLFVVIGFVLSGGYTVERATVIDAEPAAIHARVGDLARWDEWTPWKEQDPSVEVTLGAQTTGVGASQTWTSADGDGSLVFTASDPARGIEYDMTFEQWTSHGWIRYEAGDGGTRVVWGMRGTVDTPVIGGWFARLMPTLIGPSFDDGLARLKTLVERPAG